MPRKKVITIAGSIVTEIKTKKIGARVTPLQKAAVKKRMKECSYKFESEYVLACCLQGCDIHVTSDYQLQMIEQSDPKRLEIRTTRSEKQQIIQKFKESGMNNLSRFIRNCCMDNPIIVVDGLKELTVELNRIGNNLNQLTMLCHQGLITDPDITETKEALKNVYQEVISIKMKNKLMR